MTEPVTGTNNAAAARADAMQAAHFRGVLAEHRAHLDATLAKARTRLETYRRAGDRFEAHKLQRKIREHEDELGQLDWLISGLDRRYAGAWADLEGELG